MFGITGDMLGGIIRAILTAGVSYAAGKGLIGGDQAGDIVAVGTAMGVAGWSAFTNRPAKVVATPGTGPAVPTGVVKS